MGVDAGADDEDPADLDAGYRGDGEGAIPPSRFADRIEQLAREAAAARSRSDVAADADLDPDEARHIARDGLGPVVACYVEARTSDDPSRFSAAELSALDRATRDWLTCYARALGVDHESDATVRSAAELLLATHDVVEVARRSTGVSMS